MKTAKEIVAKARMKSGLDADRAMAVAVKETRLVRRRIASIRSRQRLTHKNQ